MPDQKAKRARAENELHFSARIDRCTAQYSFGLGHVKFDKAPLSEAFLLNLFCTVTAPARQSGRDMIASISVNEHFADALIPGARFEPTAIGQFIWGRSRGAHLWLPSRESLVHLMMPLFARHLDRIHVKIMPPLRGIRDVLGFHLTSGAEESDEVSQDA